MTVFTKSNLVWIVTFLWIGADRPISGGKFTIIVKNRPVEGSGRGGNSLGEISLLGELRAHRVLGALAFFAAFHHFIGDRTRQ